MTADYRIMAVPVRTAPDGLQIGKPVSLFQTHLSGNVLNGRHYHVSPDGQRFLVDTLKEVTVPVTVILNWKPES